jgi:transcriptional regulator with XRE-family HTH domain
MAALRAAKRLPQWKIAKHLGCSQARISMIETGLTEPSECEKQRIGELLAVPAELLFPELREREEANA